MYSGLYCMYLVASYNTGPNHVRGCDPISWCVVSLGGKYVHLHVHV